VQNFGTQQDATMRYTISMSFAWLFHSDANAFAWSGISLAQIGNIVAYKCSPPAGALTRKSPLPLGTGLIEGGYFLVGAFGGF